MVAVAVHAPRICFIVTLHKFEWMLKIELASEKYVTVKDLKFHIVGKFFKIMDRK